MLMSEAKAEDKTLAVFDFDGTLTRGDTLGPLLIYANGLARFIYRAIGLLPVLIGYKFRLVPRNKAKQAVFSTYFGGMKLDEFEQKCSSFAKEKIPKMIHAKALACVLRHRELGHELVIVSASMEYWIRPWAASLGFKTFICTVPEVVDGKLSGKFQGMNCYGTEKLRRLKKLYPDLSRYRIFAYGDSRGDLDILAVADKKYYRLFSPGEIL